MREGKSGKTSIVEGIVEIEDAKRGEILGQRRLDYVEDSG